MRPTRWLLLALLIVSSGTAFADAGAPSAPIDPLAERRPWTAEPDQDFASFGWSVGTAGDVNGDGYDEVIVGAIHYDNGQLNEGRAFVYHGSAAGPSAIPDWTAEPDDNFISFGFSVGTAGDVNGDGYDDVIVGAPNFDNGQRDEGRAFVYLGSSSGLNATPNWTAESDQEEAFFGISVGSAGDVNGDGYADVIVGASRHDNVEAGEGRAFVFHGSAAGLSATPDWTAESDQVGAFFARSVGSAGDVNGDGFADVIVGAHSYDNGQIHEGRAFVYHGSPTGLSTSPDWMAESDQHGAHFGLSVGTAGDVNGDGYDDAIIGANEYNNGDSDEGAAFVYHGSVGGLSAILDWTADSDQENALFGRSVGTAGDVDGDGFADAIVGAYGYDNGSMQEGVAFVYRGSADGLSSAPEWIAEPDQRQAWFGYSVATAGDVNGDGYADSIVGAPLHDHGQEDEGGAVVYRGRAA